MVCVDSKNMEFGYELLTAIPYAYMLRDKLTATRSGQWSEPLYYFSPKHEINPIERKWNGIKTATIPDAWRDIHTPELSPREFPPYKEVYANSEYKWKKPTLVIANRANIEWRTAAINYFDADILDWMFSKLKGKYKIVYIPVSIPKEIQDSIAPIEIGDREVAQRHKVKTFDGDGNWNENLLKVFANCEHYITMNGGYSILASYFSGTNTIYSKPGKIQTKELNCNSFWRWYPEINGVRTLHVPDYEQLKQKITDLYIDKLPCVNVIIRTSNRPTGFERAIKSVLKQSYQNINIIVTCDEKHGVVYTRPYPCRMVRVQTPKKGPKPEGYDYGVWFPANDYINQVKGLRGYIYILDDDNVLMYEDAIKDMVQASRPDSMTIGRVRLGGNTLPVNGRPQLYDIDTACLMYHTDMNVRWEPWKRGDYRITKYFSNFEYVDRVVAMCPRVPGNGRRKDITKIGRIMKTEKLTVQFIKPWKHYGINQVVTLPWIEGMYMLRRGLAVEYYEPEKVDVIEPKEHKPEYQDKMVRPKYKRKRKKS